MKKKGYIKNIILFAVIVVIDILVIQLFRFLTPVIVWLRLGFIIAVLSISIFLYYNLIKPEKPLRAGIILGIISFLVALLESYIVHVVIDNGNYKPLYLLPSSFALILPFILAWFYSVFAHKEEI